MRNEEREGERGQRMRGYNFSLSSSLFPSDNPFIRAVSGNILNAFLGEEVTIGFLAARSSRGSSNSLNFLPILFTSETGSTSNLNSFQSCGSSPCYYFRLLFRSVRPSSAGQYTAYISPDGNTVLLYIV